MKSLRDESCLPKLFAMDALSAHRLARKSARPLRDASMTSWAAMSGSDSPPREPEPPPECSSSTGSSASPLHAPHQYRFGLHNDLGNFTAKPPKEKSGVRPQGKAGSVPVCGACLLHKFDYGRWLCLAHRDCERLPQAQWAAEDHRPEVRYWPARPVPPDAAAYVERVLPIVLPLS
ncbi:hypothetical protein MTO96_010349 [Rhipicephalus appendiculatus]